MAQKMLKGYFFIARVAQRGMNLLMASSSSKRPSSASFSMPTGGKLLDIEQMLNSVLSNGYWLRLSTSATPNPRL